VSWRVQGCHLGSEKKDLYSAQRKGWDLNSLRPSWDEYFCQSNSAFKKAPETTRGKQSKVDQKKSAQAQGTVTYTRQRKGGKLHKNNAQTDLTEKKENHPRTRKINQGGGGSYLQGRKRGGRSIPKGKHPNVSCKWKWRRGEGELREKFGSKR